MIGLDFVGGGTPHDCGSNPAESIVMPHDCGGSADESIVASHDCGGSQSIALTANSTGLAPGVYDTTLLLQSNSGRQPSISIPFRLIVPAYRQGVNAGGNAYVDVEGDPWAADKAFANGSWGYTNKSATASTSSAIAGTLDDPLYQREIRKIKRPCRCET